MLQYYTVLPGHTWTDFVDQETRIYRWTEHEEMIV